MQPEEEQQQIVRETFQLVSKRDDNVCNFLEGGTFWGGIVYTFGDLELFNGDERAVDRVSADTDGNYNKLNFYLGRNQQLTEKLSAKALFSAQWADTNLGGFEKFFLGGPFGSTAMLARTRSGRRWGSTARGTCASSSPSVAAEPWSATACGHSRPRRSRPP